MSDWFDKQSPSLESPASNGSAVAPSDTADLSHPSRALYVGTPGNLKIITIDGATLTLVGVSGWVPIRVKRVLSVGTTAGDIIAVW